VCLEFSERTLSTWYLHFSRRSGSRGSCFRDGLWLSSNGNLGEPESGRDTYWMLVCHNVGVLGQSSSDAIVW
jgi:hypothetical protein